MVNGELSRTGIDGLSGPALSGIGGTPMPLRAAELLRRTGAAVGFALALLLITASPIFAQAKKDAGKPKPAEKANPNGTMYLPDLKAEAAHYRVVTIPLPDDVVLECGAIECGPGDAVYVGTRRGDVYRVNNAYADPPTGVTFTKFATGLHEVLGLAYNLRDKALYACTRQEITKLTDRDGDGVADAYDTYCDGWAISGDYHEYGLMSPFDREGNLYVALCLTGSFTSKVPWRGWCVKVTPDGVMHPFASGVRSPGGVGFDAAGRLFFTDNQGPWNGTSALKLLQQGSFQGNPTGNPWYDLPLAKAEMGPRPKDPQTNSRIWVEAEKIPEFVPPPVWLPHVRTGQSASGIAADASGGKFGPFAGQLFVGDQHHSNVMRCALETVEGRVQGVAFPFKYGFGSGIVPMRQAPDGSIWVGGTNRGWGSVGPKQYALERLVYTGKPPFEMQDMKAKPDGFEVTFTEPADPKAAGDVKSYALSTYSYLYRSDYGSPEVDESAPTVTKATVAADGKSVRLTVDGLKVGSVHELHADGVTAAGGTGAAAAGAKLVHPVAYYTLWAVPKTDR
ncbi:MAG: putative rane-bound dehydrogenase domain protein [Phycisphaerales bacterium]|nr:putative rane-bound dehydrogenase domain protein [Phycisphaerales bacterium]